MTFRRLIVVATLTALVTVLAGAAAVAAPDGPPDYGVMEPDGLADKGCPWPTEFNDLHTDAQKCLPQSIPWSETEHGSGVRIITDDLTGVGDWANTAAGQVTFRCQSRVGLQYKVTVQGLQPRTTYAVEVVQLPSETILLGHFQTDHDGNGILNGILHLPKGGYGFLFFVKDAGVPVLALADEPNETGQFGPGVVGISVL